MEDRTKIPRGVRGVYVLLRHDHGRFNVLYVGLAAGRGGVRARLYSHTKSETKRKLCTHFSVFEAWPNITKTELAELEGLFREIYRKDREANKLNKYKKHWPIQKVRVRNLRKWHEVNKV